tara:strand:- start:233 stop:421 length:189 start_codon:yes stop_codon:yes gene_type:complete
MESSVRSVARARALRILGSFICPNVFRKDEIIHRKKAQIIDEMQVFSSKESFQVDKIDTSSF